MTCATRYPNGLPGVNLCRAYVCTASVAAYVVAVYHQAAPRINVRIDCRP